MEQAREIGTILMEIRTVVLDPGDGTMLYRTEGHMHGC